MTCVGKDPRCPCQDGDACHYKDCGGTKAWPVQRQWVGLTDEEYQEILKQHDGAGLLAFYNLVEAKLREKNT